MRRCGSLFLLVTTLVLAAPAAADSGRPAATGSIPGEKEQPQKLRIPGLAELEEDHAFLLISRIFPVGWSPEGLFAYVYEPADEGCGCYFFELIVQNLRSDRVIWHYKYSSEQHDLGDPELFEDISAIWKAKAAEFSAKLSELGIVRRHEPSLETFAGNMDQLSVKMTSQERGDDESDFVDLSRYEAVLAGPKGSKSIFQSDGVTGFTTEIHGLLAVTANGYLRSPFEKRIAVLIEEKWLGWEGPPLVMRLRFAGADLEYGFH